MRAFLAGAALLARFRNGAPPPAARVVETQGYVDARSEALALCRNLGLPVDNEHWEQAGIGDFIRLAYAQGWIANELRLASIDSSDAIDKAINTPGSIVEQLPGESLNRWTVRAVKQAVAYGVSKEACRK